MASKKDKNPAVTGEYQTAYVGIDPGKTGAVSVFYVGQHGTGPGSMITRVVYDMPETEVDKLNFMREIGTHAKQVLVITEEVGMHMRGNAASAAIKLAVNAAEMRMCALAMGYCLETVRPQKWQPLFLGKITLPGCPKEPEAGASKEAVSAWRKEKGKRREVLKSAIKNRVQALFPQMPITKDNADAVALAWYCEKFHSMSPNGAVKPVPAHELSGGGL